MSKTKEELNKLKEEIEAVNEKLQELTEEELAQVTGGSGGRYYAHVDCLGLSGLKVDGTPFR